MNEWKHIGNFIYLGRYYHVWRKDGMYQKTETNMPPTNDIGFYFLLSLLTTIGISNDVARYIIRDVLEVRYEI